MSKNLAIALEIKNRNKKKYAKGGAVNESAKTEQRPMPSERDHDSKMVGRNSGNKAPSNDDWGSNITVKQAQKPSVTKLSQPKIVGSDAFSVRNMNMRDDENDLGNSIYPESDRAQPKKRYDEMGANRQGPEVPDRAHQHKARMAAYQQASESQYAQDMADDNMKKTQSPLGRYAKGGEVEGAKTSTGGAKTGGAKTSTTGNKTKTGGSNPGGASTGGAGTVTITTRDLGSKGINVSNVGGKTDSKNHGGMDPGDEDDDGKTMMAIGGAVMQPKDNHNELEERDDEMHMMNELSSTEHGEQPAHWRDELDAAMQNPNKLDMENQHSTGRKPYARGGEVSPEPEIEEEHYASITAAIMAKRDRMKASIDSGAHDEDAAAMFAEGGQVDLDLNSMEQPNGYYARNEDAALKENYDSDFEDLHEPKDSNLKGDQREEDSENKLDMISAIRKSMAKRRSSK